MQHSRRDYLHDVNLRGFELCAKRGGETSQRRLRGGVVQDEVGRLKRKSRCDRDDEGRTAFGLDFFFSDNIEKRFTSGLTLSFKKCGVNMEMRDTTAR
jgi:hypothetical protein